MYFTYENAKIRELIDKTLDSVTLSTDDSLVFKTTDGVTYKLYHEQECCEYVYIKDGQNVLARRLSIRTNHTNNGLYLGLFRCILV